MTNIISLIRNKYYADLLRSKWYKRLVMKNPRRALNIKWKANFGHAFPWDNPQTLDEKIGWLQVNTDTSLWSELADKYEVRKYVEEKAGGKYLVPIYGVWDRVEDIDFEQLPNQFVIKCTHDSGSTFIVRNKEKEDLESLKLKINAFLKRSGGYTTFEPHYFNIKHRIIAEKVLENDNTFYSTSVVDYKIWCFGGEPYYAFVCYDRHREPDGHIAVVYDLYSIKPWKPIREGLSSMMKDQNFRDVPEPINLSEMLEISRKLSQGFPQVRIDLYHINGKIYFSEMTFTACSGINYFYSQETQLKMGQLIPLDNKE